MKLLSFFDNILSEPDANYEVNKKLQIKQLARQAYQDQQSQDNEGGVFCGTSFVVGFSLGYEQALLDLSKQSNTQTQQYVEIRQLQKGEDL